MKAKMAGHLRTGGGKITQCEGEEERRRTTECVREAIDLLDVFFF